MHERQTLFQCAELAIQYAHSQILRGSSQLQNNALSPNYFDALDKGLYQERTYKWNEVTEAFKTNKMDELLIMHEKTIKFSSKSSLGSCIELAHQALEYILYYYPHIYAEIYTIKGGDHYFLVLNRKEKSIANDPGTWGENAIICDPWANQSYLASAYLDKLESAYTVTCFIDFPPHPPIQPTSQTFLHLYREVHEGKEEKIFYRVDGKHENQYLDLNSSPLLQGKSFETIKEECLKPENSQIRDAILKLTWDKGHTIYKQNRTTKFNPDKMVLMPWLLFNTRVLSKLIVSKLKNQFIKDISLLVDILEKYHARLLIEQGALPHNYSNKNKITVFNSKMAQIQNQISAAKKCLEQMKRNEPSYENYRLVEEELSTKHDSLLEQAISSMQFSAADLHILYNPQFFSTKKSTSEVKETMKSHLQNIADEANAGLAGIRLFKSNFK